MEALYKIHHATSIAPPATRDLASHVVAELLRFRYAVSQSALAAYARVAVTYMITIILTLSYKMAVAICGRITLLATYTEVKTNTTSPQERTHTLRRAIARRRGYSSNLIKLSHKHTKKDACILLLMFVLTANYATVCAHADTYYTFEHFNNLRGSAEDTYGSARGFTYDPMSHLRELFTKYNFGQMFLPSTWIYSDKIGYNATARVRTYTNESKRGQVERRFPYAKPEEHYNTSAWTPQDRDDPFRLPPEDEQLHLN